MTLDCGKVHELAKVLTLDFGNMKINKIQQNKHNNWPQNLQMNMNIENKQEDNKLWTLRLQNPQVWKLTFSVNAT